MENASDALIMAMAVIIFVVALTVAINSFSQAREVSELVLYTADETNYYVYEEVTEGASQNRIVGLETIIPTLYKYSKENYSVLFLQGDNYNKKTGNFEDNAGNPVKPKILELYKSPDEFANGNKHVWGRSDDKYFKFIESRYSKKFITEGEFNNIKNNLHNIFSFDIEEETLRREPWASSEEETKRNLDCFLNGLTYTLASDGSDYINYKIGTSSFISKYTGRSFVENVAEITYKKNDREDEDDNDREKVEVDTSRINGKKRIYIFTLINSIKTETE